LAVVPPDGDVRIGGGFRGLFYQDVGPQVPELAFTVRLGVVFRAEPSRIEEAVGRPGPERRLIVIFAVERLEVGLEVGIVARLRSDARRLNRREEHDRRLRGPGGLGSGGLEYA
jgi:hypothetical protein